MKHNKKHDNAQGTEPQLVPLQFEFTHPTAVAVCIAGTFNDWNPTSKPMRSSGTGRWWKETGLLPGTYEYCLVVDGEWMPDPSARETVCNPFGGRNSVLKVASSPDAAHRADAIDLPLKLTTEIALDQLPLRKHQLIQRKLCLSEPFYSSCSSSF